MIQIIGNEKVVKRLQKQIIKRVKEEKHENKASAMKSFYNKMAQFGLKLRFNNIEYGVIGGDGYIFNSKTKEQTYGVTISDWQTYCNSN